MGVEKRTTLEAASEDQSGGDDNNKALTLQGNELKLQQIEFKRQLGVADAKI